MNRQELNAYQWMISDKEPRLRKAAKEGNVDAVQSILNSTSGRLPPFVYRRAFDDALASNQLGVVKALLKNGYDEQAKLEPKDVAFGMRCAAASNQEALCRFLAEDPRKKLAASAYYEAALAARKYGSPPGSDPSMLFITDFPLIIRRGNSSLADFLEEKGKTRLSELVSKYDEFMHALEYIAASCKNPRDPEAELRAIGPRLQIKISQAAMKIACLGLSVPEAPRFQRIRNGVVPLPYEKKDKVVTALDQKIRLRDDVLGEYGTRQALCVDINSLIDLLRNPRAVLATNREISAKLDDFDIQIGSIRRWGGQKNKLKENVEYVRRYAVGASYDQRKELLRLLGGTAKPDPKTPRTSLPAELKQRIAEVQGVSQKQGCLGCFG